MGGNTTRLEGRYGGNQSHMVNLLSMGIVDTLRGYINCRFPCILRYILDT